jgi:integrase
VSPARRREFGAIKRRASGKYSASYVGPDGVRRFGGQEFATKSDAQAWLAQRQAEVYTRSWVDPSLGRITLTEYGTRWIAEHKLSPRTRDLYAGLFRLHIEPFLGARAIEEIKPETVRWWRARLREDGRSESTTAKAYRLLRAIFNASIDDGRMTRNPCRIKGADRESPPERPVASVAEVFDLAARVGAPYRAFVLTAALASLRWGELVALRRRDIDLDEGLIFVRHAMVERGGSLELSLPKNSRTRIVALPGVLVDELRSHLERVDADPDAPVFTGGRGGTPRRGNWRANVKWAAAVKGAGLPAGFRFHDLRHTGNHLAAQTGASTRELMQRMGHSTVRAAMIYQHATDARSRLLADRLDALVKERRDDSK